MPADNEPLLAQLRVQAAIDRELRRALRDAARESDQIIADIAGRGTTSVSGVVRAARLMEMRNQLLQVQNDLWRTIGDDVRRGRDDAARAAARVQGAYEVVLLRAGLTADQRVTYLRSLEAQAQRALRNAASRLQAEIPLSKQVYKTQALAKRWVSNRVTQLIAQGTSARGIAKAVSQFISPMTPGGVSYAALRLGRTELQHAFHATSVQGYDESPFVVSVRWHLSGSHSRPDQCNDYASRGGGLYDPKNVPAKPHPQCLCYVTPETPDPAQFINSFHAGAYDSWLSAHGVD